MMTTASAEWQLARDAALRYQRVLVPSIIGPFARELVDYAAIPLRARVIDLGCGTGIAGRRAAEAAGPAGSVVGVDNNPGMIAVANSLPPPDGAPVRWVEASAADLPLPPASADYVLAAQVLQFLADPMGALQEAYRVLRPKGTIAISLWCEADLNPYFDAVHAAVSRHLGPDVAAELGAAFRLPAEGPVRQMLVDAGFVSVRATTCRLDLDLPGPEAFVPEHIPATPMADAYAAASAETRATIGAEVTRQLLVYRSGTGICVPFRVHLLRATA